MVRKFLTFGDMIHSRVSSKAQVTIPKAVRAALGVKEGDLLAYEIEGDRVVLRRIATSSDPFENPFATFTEWADEEDCEASAIFEIGTIVRVPFPYVERERFQARPALIVSRLLGPDDPMIWTMMITSARRSSWPDDVPIGPNHIDYGLPVPCVVRTAKIAVLGTASIERSIGRLPTRVLDLVRVRMRSALDIA